MSLRSPDRGYRDSRHLAIARNLTGEIDEGLARKFEQRVLLTAAPATLAKPAGKIMVRTAVNMIARFCRSIELKLDSAPALEGQMLSYLREIDSSVDVRAVRFVNPSKYAAVLAVGESSGLAGDTVRIDSHAWLAAVAMEHPLPRWIDGSDTNPFGALAAAALGAAEVFKRLVRPHLSKAAPLGDVTFSTFDYSIGDPDDGPALPREVRLPRSLLAGVGAVGNAFLFALSEVKGISGELLVVDEQHIEGESNLNRYALAIESDVRLGAPLAKTELARRLFAGTRVEIREAADSLESVLEAIGDGRLPRPTVVLSALDNNNARHALQDLWPDVVLEGATSGTLFQVFRHQHGSGSACLRCIHPLRIDGGGRYEDRLAEVSGLAAEWIAKAARDPSVILSADVVARVADGKREVLRSHVGQAGCAVLAAIEELSTRERGELPFEPAVSFTSLLAGTLMAAEFVKYASKMPSVLRTWYQADPMFTLEQAGLQTMKALSDCYCVERREVIERYRRAKSAVPNRVGLKS